MHTNLTKMFFHAFILDFAERFTDLWNNRALKAEFTMPPPNEFICTNFDIISKDIEPSTLPLQPEKILVNNVCECFYKLDARFKLPHAFIYLYLMSPKTISSVRNMISTSLYSMIVKHYMSEKLYPAVCAGLGYEMYSEEKGMLLKLSGYNEKLPVLLNIITNNLKSIGGLMEKSVFETYRKQLKKNCYNNLINSKFFNKDCRLFIVEEDHKFTLDRYLEADKITFEDIVAFSNSFLDQLKVKILVQGNIEKSTSLEIGQTVLRNLNCNAIDDGARLESRARKLPIGSHVLHIKSMLPDDKNSTITNYIQIGSSSIRLQCFIELIEKVIEEPLFDILRTQEQLGYSVGCSHRFNHGVLGISFTVQSQEDKNPTTAVDARIEKFIHEHMLSALEKMTDDEFATVQTALIKLKNIVDVELESEVNRNWSEITSSEYIFNRLELESQMIAKLTKEKIVDFYKSRIIAPDARKLSIQVIGNGTDENAAGDGTHVPKLQILPNHQPKVTQAVILDMNTFKDSLELYPIIKTAIEE